MLGLLWRGVPRLLTHPGLSLCLVGGIVLQDKGPRLWFTVAADEMKAARRQDSPDGAPRHSTPRSG